MTHKYTSKWSINNENNISQKMHLMIQMFFFSSAHVKCDQIQITQDLIGVLVASSCRGPLVAKKSSRLNLSRTLWVLRCVQRSAFVWIWSSSSKLLCFSRFCGSRFLRSGVTSDVSCISFSAKDWFKSFTA